MILVHFVSRAELRKLFAAVAVLKEVDGEPKWVAPAWWSVMYERATH